MGIRRQYQRVLALLALGMFTTAVNGQQPPVAKAKPKSVDARLATFETGAGEKYFALSVTPTQSLPVAENHEVLLMVDTSATMSGAYRQQSLAAVKSLLGSLGKNARVQLVAVDTRPISLTKTFVAPTSDEMQQALAALDRRAPLGATDLPAALAFATKSFPQDAAAHSVVYVGSGTSKAALVSAAEMNKFVDAAHASQTSFSSVAIGVDRNPALLAALANQSGGSLVLANPKELTSDQAGQTAAAMVQTPIAWPTSVKMPSSLTEVYPQRMPPLRADRDTIVIGRLGDDAANVALEVRAASGAENLEFKWTPAVEKSSPDFAFLPKLVDLSKPDHGVFLPTLGSGGLRDAANFVLQSSDQIVELGQRALSTGDTAGARRAAEEALRRDPANPQAVALKKLAASDTVPVATKASDDGDLRLVNAAPAAGEEGSGLLERVEREQGKFLDDIETLRSVRAQQIRTQVEETLKDSRLMLSEGDHEQAINSLKASMESVDRTPELDPETRQQLRDRLEIAVREAERTGAVQVRQRIEADQQRATELEKERIARELRNKEYRLTQLMQRFNALMSERRYMDAQMEVAPEIEALAPNSVIASSAFWSGLLTKNNFLIMELVNRRFERFAETLYQVELSHVPLPDEPPLIYPSAEKWEEITERRRKYKSVDLVKPGSAEEKIVQKLQEEINIEEPEIELARLMENIASEKEITIVFDPVGLDEAGVTRDQIVSHNLKGITLRSAMRLILGPLQLTYVIKDEVLQITSIEKASEQLVTKVYPVGDLVVPIISNIGGGQGGFGQGAGMGGGGFGGGGGGMGGGGMGGGMGGMGGGGGFGGGAFDVNDELNLNGSSKPTTAAPTAKPQVRKPQAVAAASVAALKVAAQSGETLDQAWDRYFQELSSSLEKDEQADAQLAKSQAAVRQTVREMMEKKDFAGVSALISSALRNGHNQPWMYEALSIALRANDAPADEIERVLMSGVDLAEDVNQVMYMALYMSKTGLESSALKLYRQVAAQYPNRAEPYVQGLACARALNDREGIQWACEGILSQAWENRYQGLEQEAKREAQAMILALEKEQKTDEAKDFEKRIRQALVRDCRVEVSWTGDADLDLQVEEPSGTVCSVKAPRTSAGGVLLGDSFSHNAANAPGTFREVYVCSQAFAGDYRMYIKRVWGKVTANKVTVDVYANYGAPNQKHMRQQITLGADPALVVVELDQGRRQEPLADVQVQNVARLQNAFGRQVLAQQMAGLNGSAVNNYTQSILNRRNSLQNQLLYGLGNRGAVGYIIRPTILREGLEMFSNAVISADRRYVRVTPHPSITAIGQVTTFSVATGAQNNQGGGGGAGS